jgi:hypothetical protein
MNRSALNCLKAIDEHVRTLQSLGVAPETCMTVLQDLYEWMGIPAHLKQDPVKSKSVKSQSSKRWYNCQEIAEEIDAYSISHKPHAQFIGAMIRHLGCLRPELDFKVIATEVTGKADVPHYLYSDSVVERLRLQLDQWRRPSTIVLDGRTYYVAYRNHPNKNQHLKVS